MAAYSRPALRNLFDESPTPHIAHPPRTHCRDFYIATDGSYRTEGDGGLGVVIETRGGKRVARLSLPDAVPNNNIAEYRALHLGLDVLAARTPRTARVGVLVDHDDLAANVNRAILAGRGPDTRPPHPFSVPRGDEPPLARDPRPRRGVRRTPCRTDRQRRKPCTPPRERS